MNNHGHQNVYIVIMHYRAKVIYGVTLTILHVIVYCVLLFDRFQNYICMIEVTIVHFNYVTTFG